MIRVCVEGLAHSYVCHASFMCVPWLIQCDDELFICVIYMREIKYSYVWTWLIHMCDHDSFICVTMTHSYVWPPIHVCEMNDLHAFDTRVKSRHTYEWGHVIPTNTSRHPHDCVFSHVCQTCMNHSFHTYEWGGHTYEWVMVTHMNESWSHIWMSHGHTYEWVMVTHMNESCSHIWILDLTHINHTYE